MKPDLNLMRKSGSILSETLRILTTEFVEEGLSTKDISNKAEEIIRSYEHSVPAFLGYYGFTGSACVSVNDAVVHGVPREDVILKNGDIVSIDCGVNYKGHFSDACRTICVGDSEPKTKKLLRITEEALGKGISAAKVGNKVGDISYQVQRYVERNGFKVSLEFVGHGIGTKLHDKPQVPNYGPPNTGQVLVEGMCLAIEPVVFDGVTDWILDEDQWTVRSKFGNLSAHFEDTVILTKYGPEIITK